MQLEEMVMLEMQMVREEMTTTAEITKSLMDIVVLTLTALKVHMI